MTLIQSHSNSAGLNLSIEEYLFTKREDDILFLYVNEPCVVMGHNQNVLSEVNTRYCTENNIPIFRRMSGGGTVFHDSGNVNYCFISNRIQGKSPLQADFLQIMVQVLHDLQIEVLIGKRHDLWLPGGYKISGTASHVTKTRELHHGTLLYDSNLAALDESLSPNAEDSKFSKVASVHSPVKNIRSYLIDKKFVAPEVSVFLKFITAKLLNFYSLEDVSELSPHEILMIEPLKPI